VARARLLVDLLPPRRRFRYGDEHSCQRADLHLPRGPGPHPVVVMIHGGSWRAGYGRIVMRPLAADVARRGYAAWNIEYRRIGRGQGGGWPATFLDVAAAIDHLARVPAPLDLARLALVGHSAGGQLALWAAGRSQLADGAPGARPLVEPVAAVSAAGVNDLAQSQREVPDGVVGLLMGGGADEVPDRYAIADPLAHVPLAIPVLVVHGTDDTTVSVRRSRNYAAAAREAGGRVDLVEIAGSAGAHSRHLDPDGPSWAAITRWLGDHAPAVSPPRSGAPAPPRPPC
jgi:acetyl esterase/lipase